MRKVTVTAKTVELAVEDALQLLNIGRDRARVEVVSAPTKGFLGIGAKDAQIEVSVIEDPVEDAERFLRELFIEMGFTIRITSEINDRDVLMNLSGDKVGTLIGKHGQTLDALQHIVNAVGNKFTEKPYRFVLDAENYRQRRQEALVKNALKLAEKAVALGREIRLDAMKAHDRKLIHAALQDRSDIRTESRGVEPDRAIVIVPNNLSSAGKSMSHSRSHRNHRVRSK